MEKEGEGAKIPRNHHSIRSYNLLKEINFSTRRVMRIKAGIRLEKVLEE